jgi:hypothetical protein
MTQTNRENQPHLQLMQQLGWVDDQKLILSV